MTLYLVDDDATQLRMMSRMLSTAGFDVQTYETIAEVEAMVLQSPEQAELVISDYEMPLGDGLELAHRLALVENAPPMLICTGCDRLPGLENEPLVRGVLHKPYRKEELLSQVRCILGRN